LYKVSLYKRSFIRDSPEFLVESVFAQITASRVARLCVSGSRASPWQWKGYIRRVEIASSYLIFQWLHWPSRSVVGSSSDYKNDPTRFDPTRAASADRARRRPRAAEGETARRDAAGRNVLGKKGETHSGGLRAATRRAAVRVGGWCFFFRRGSQRRHRGITQGESQSLLGHPADTGGFRARSRSISTARISYPRWLSRESYRRSHAGFFRPSKRGFVSRGLATRCAPRIPVVGIHVSRDPRSVRIRVCGNVVPQPVSARAPGDDRSTRDTIRSREAMDETIPLRDDR